MTKRQLTPRDPFAARDPFAEGLEHARARRWPDALACLERAVLARPNDPDVLTALAETALALNLPDGARAMLERAQDLAPERIDIIVRLSEARLRSGRHAEAIDGLRQALERASTEASLWLALGNAVREIGDTDNAMVFYRETLRLKPQSTEALGNLADLLFDEGALAESLQLYDQALAKSPGHAQLRLNHALARLSAGDLKRGWADYEARLKIQGRSVLQPGDGPRWDGRPRKGKPLLVRAEQGIGDQILFASCLSDLVDDGPITLIAEPRLVPLFARSFPTMGVQPWGSATTPETGRRAIELASLPRHLRPTLESFPSPHAYLKANDAEIAHWGAWMRDLGPPPYVGLSWRSGSTQGLRAIQYAPLSAWAGLMRNAHATFINAQYASTPTEIEELSRLSGKPLHTPPALDQKNEIDRSAAMLRALTILIAAPTSVAVLGAALGVPTCRVLYNRPWTSLGQNVEPFTPSARNLVPHRPGDWASVMTDAAAAIADCRT